MAIAPSPELTITDSELTLMRDRAEAAGWPMPSSGKNPAGELFAIFPLLGLALLVCRHRRGLVDAWYLGRERRVWSVTLGIGEPDAKRQRFPSLEEALEAIFARGWAA